jgi:hypothetical protein
MQILSKRARDFIEAHNIKGDLWQGLADFAHLPPAVDPRKCKNYYRPSVYQIRCIRKKIVEAVSAGVTETSLRQGGMRVGLRWDTTNMHWKTRPEMPADFVFARDFRKLVLSAIEAAVQHHKFQETIRL